ncbi:MAG TPA: FAD-dependent oxidoreductase, partial [Myxococcaceae bacterium]|nr:FAD-dependent oxidoreductase [Myxococcaceae bacterium]
ENRLPVEFLLREGKVAAVRLAVTREGRPVPGTEEELPAELVAVAIGQERRPPVALAFPGVALDERGRVKVDPVTHRTGHPKVWSGGDCVNGGKEVVNAVAEAKLAVRDMHRHLMGE